ncbi:MAG: PA14 domain-containing protein [Lentisphaeraceae bacterium]|nr:PA14 domain-containing protein [Lentisphaeraceae bacterium]
MKKLFTYTLGVLLLSLAQVQAQYDYPEEKDYCCNFNPKICILSSGSKEKCGIRTYWGPIIKCYEPNKPTPPVDYDGYSTVNVLTYSYTHDVLEFSIGENTSGCAPCSGGSTGSTGIPQLDIQRYHKFRQMGDRGSFGYGIFISFDVNFKLYMSGSTPRVDMFFAGDANTRRYFKQGNKFFDTFARSSKELVLKDINGNTTTDMALAHSADLLDFEDNIYHFEIFEEDADTKHGRIKSYTDKNGYGFTIYYEHAANATVTDFDDKFKMTSVSDSNNRTVLFEYLPARRNGVNVISKITLPNGSDIIYTYGSGDPSIASNDALSAVTYPDGTNSSFSSTTSGNVTLAYISDAGEKGAHRNKRLILDNNFVADIEPGRDGQTYFNQASLLVNRVELGDTAGTDAEFETAFEIFQNPNQHISRRVYEGGNRLKNASIMSANIYKTWEKTGSNNHWDDFTGVSNEETTAKGDWKFYSANSQGRPPILFDDHGLKYKFVYNGDNQMTKKIYEDGTIERKSYNSLNLVTRERDRLGRVTHYDYDSRGNLTKKTVGLLAQPNGNINETIPGLLARVYDWTENVLPTNFESLIPVETVSVPNVEVNMTDRDERYALLFTGEIEITTAGDYDFFLSSDDGSKLYIDGVEVIDNDGTHGNTEVATVTPLNLTAGKHDIRVEFFEAYGLQVLSLQYQGPDSGNLKTLVPDSVYSHTTVAEELDEIDVTTPETAEYTKTYYPSGHANQFLLATETDANLNTIEYIYNSDNLLTSIIEPDDTGSGTHVKSSFTYDSAKRLLSSSDAVGRTTTFEYDSRDRITKTTFSDGSTELFFFGENNYDANLLVKKKDRNGNTTSFTYDAKGRPTTTIRAYSVMNDDGTSETVNPVSIQSVEICTFLPGTELKATCTIDGELTEYFYDYRNRLVETRRHADNNSALVNKSYFKNNLKQWDEDPYGRRTYFSYRITGTDKSDTAMTRMVRETIPGSVVLPNGYYSDINNIDYDHSNNAVYLLTKYEKDAEGQTTAVIDPREVRHESVYDSRGRKTFQINDAAGLVQKTQTIYDANSNIIGIINPRYFDIADGALDGQVMEYTSRNLLKSRTIAKIYDSGLTSPDEATEFFTYYDDGRSKEHTDFRGNTSTKVWKQCCGRLGVIAGPVYTDKEGNQRRTVQTMQYDYQGNITHKTTLDWDATMALPPCCYPNPTDTDTLEEVTIKYDSRHRPIAKTVWLQPLADVLPNDVPIATDPLLGLTTTYEYFDELNGHSELNDIVDELENDGIILGVPAADEAQGSALITTNPAGEKSVTIKDGTGRKVASGMLSKVDSSLVSWSTVTYDTLAGNFLETKTTSALGDENKVHTDGAGRRIKIIDAEGEFTAFEYDNNGNLVYSKDANNVEMTCQYDNLNRDILCKDTVEDSLGVNRQKVYDLNNNIVRVIDTKGKSELFSYDDRNRRTNHWDRLETDGHTESSLPPVADSTRYQFDKNSNVIKITDVQENETVYVFDARNLNTQITYEDGGITKCSYDALGRKEVYTDQLQDTVTYHYDLASRMTSREYRLSGSTLESTDTFEYDEASRLETATKERYGNTVSMTYDEIGRKKTETLTLNGDSYTVTYDVYDLDSRVKDIYYPTGTDTQNNYQLVNRNKLTQSYTDRNQLKTVDFNAANIITSTYDAGMRESTRTFGNTLVNTMTYNLDNTRAGIAVAGKADLSFTYGHDSNKNITSESSAGTAMTGFGFDASFDVIDRVTQWDRDSATDTQTWTLDNIGNWDNTSGSLEGSAFNENRTHNGVHELTVLDGNNLVYDDKGNMTTDASANSLIWDIDNHLVSFNSVTFSYDALGRRVEKSDGINSTLFVCDGQRVIEEYTSTGGTYTLQRSYVYGTYVDDIVAKIEAVSTPTVLYYHSDRQFNIRGLTDSSGAIKELYAYTPYGKQTIVSSIGTNNNNYGFTGRYFDNETGLWYFRARYFSDVMGRFISRDPLGYIDGMSLYNAYFAEKLLVDPSGMIVTPPSVGSSGGEVSQHYRPAYPALRKHYGNVDFGDIFGVLFYHSIRPANGGMFSYFFHSTFYKLDIKKMPWEVNVLNPNAKEIATSFIEPIGAFFAWCTGDDPDFKILNMSLGFVSDIYIGNPNDIEHEVMHLDYYFPTLIEPLHKTALKFNSAVNKRKQVRFRKSYPANAFGYNQYSITFDTCDCEAAASELNELIPKAIDSIRVMNEDHYKYNDYFGIGNR